LVVLPELRKDPITDRWVIIATDRAQRPSDFAREPVEFTPGRICPFCPGMETKTPPEVLAIRDGGLGAHEVIIETSVHTENLASMPEKQVERVVWAFRERVLDLKKDKRLRYILLFKNYGAAAGATMEHPHSQLIALPVVPKRVQEEMDGAIKYFGFKERCVFCDLIRQEMKDQTRVVSETDRFVVIEPWASRFPFETWILPRRHQSHFESIDQKDLEGLAFVLRSTLRKLERVLEKPAYNFVIHTAPVQDAASDYFHWHIELMPKLTKLAGFEWGTGFYTNPTPPEESARFLRDAGLS